MKKYLKIKNGNLENQATHMEVKVDYDLGGTNCFSGRAEQRGYYLHVQPIILETEIISGIEYTFKKCIPRNGVKTLLNEVKRQSNKGYDAALELAKEKMPQILAERFGEYNVEVTEL